MATDFSTKMSAITEVNSRLHACSIESLQTSDGTFACGTYELNEEQKTREGEVIIAKFENNSVNVLSTLPCESGVLDMKVAHGWLGAAMSVGTLDLYNIDGVETPSLNKVVSVTNVDEGLFLSLDFDNRLSSSQTGMLLDDRIAVSTQSGSVLVYRFSEGELLEDNHISNIHSLFGESMPVWITAFNCHDKNILLSGGDDCKFRLWDLRNTDATSSSSGCIHTNKSHTAGVTSAQWNPRMEHVFVTGSYDESVSVWDQRRMNQPLLRIETGGGVWRSKWFPSETPGSEYLVTSSMQGGSRVYRLDNTVNNSSSDNVYSYAMSDSVVQTDARNDNHLAYGIDVIGSQTINNDASNQETLTLASCSFYDNLIQIWSATF